MSEQRSWVIDVCRYCGALAVYPGCKHWRINDRWTTAVVVHGRWNPTPPREDTER